VKIRVSRVCLPRGPGGELLNRAVAVEVEICDGDAPPRRTVELLDGAGPAEVAAGTWVAAEEVARCASSSPPR